MYNGKIKAHTKAVLACADPVALDYHATKYLLYSNSKIPVHNPDNKKGPLYQYLKKCSEITDYVYDEKHVAVKSYDFHTDSLQDDSRLSVIAKRQWGYDIKTLMKYITLRYFVG